MSSRRLTAFAPHSFPELWAAFFSTSMKSPRVLVTTITALLASLIILTYVPAIGLWLPRTMGL